MKRNTKGFSLIELIVVIAIMAVLVGVLAPMFTSRIEKARRSKDMANAKQIEKVLTYALVEDEIHIPEGMHNYGYGAWVMICKNKDRSNAPVPYHNRKFTGGWCGVDTGVSVNGNVSHNDQTFNNDLAKVLKDAGIDISNIETASKGNSEGWDWIIIEVCYGKDDKVTSRIYSGFKNEDGGINRTPTSNIERLMGLE